SYVLLGAGFCFNVGRGISAFSPYFLGQLASYFSLSTAIALCGLFFLLAGLLMLLMPDLTDAEDPTWQKGEVIVRGAAR
ncbi:MAG: hypothetical protein U5M50_01985, partial [Sphingobium sp.]|nr:hypothetical protein [Sphingobium sp.]